MENLEVKHVHPFEMPYGPFNKLSASQVERLAILSEELGEVQQVVGKILRHGYQSTHPESTVTNRDLLERELGDLTYAIDRLWCDGEISKYKIDSHAKEKKERVKKYLHHNKD